MVLTRGDRRANHIASSHAAPQARLGLLFVCARNPFIRERNLVGGGKIGKIMRCRLGLSVVGK